MTGSLQKGEIWTQTHAHTQGEQPYEPKIGNHSNASTSQETSKIAGKHEKLGERHEMNSPSGA